VRKSVYPRRGGGKMKSKNYKFHHDSGKNEEVKWRASGVNLPTGWYYRSLDGLWSMGPFRWEKDRDEDLNRYLASFKESNN
jgi:hypothetical protein